ncbi:PD40 domain-containing protein [Sinomicrobium pectinilyticum]|nr:PD40 domain-containing protein [Sinomicrobium pectinilyticum]
MAPEKREHNYDIYVSGYGKSIFQKPNVLSNSINTEAYEADVFVAPDESYIIFCSIRKEGYGKGDLYISFREDGGNWSEAKNMDPQINTKVMFYETLAHDIYNHPVKHIYLCHDNAINADYLAEIISLLKQEDYKIVSFEEALADPVYEQKDAYYKKWGISWLYRWMDTQKERIKRMKQEPDLSGIEKLYEDIQKKNH